MCVSRDTAQLCQHFKRRDRCHVAETTPRKKLGKKTQTKQGNLYGRAQCVYHQCVYHQCVYHYTQPSFVSTLAEGADAHVAKTKQEKKPNKNIQKHHGS